MAVSSKMAKMLNSMFSKTNKELDEIVGKKTGDSMEGIAARNEISRRSHNREIKQERNAEVRYSSSDLKKMFPGDKPPSKDELREFREILRSARESELEKDEFEFIGDRFPKKKEMAKGGMAKKKVAAKKPAVKKPAVKKPIKKGK